MKHCNIKGIVSVQCNTYLAITGAIRGTSKEKLYSKLGLKSLQVCHWFRKLCYFYKFYKNGFPQYVLNIVSLRHSSYIIRNAENHTTFENKT